MIIPSSLLAKCRDRIRLIAIEIWRALSKTKAPFPFSPMQNRISIVKRFLKTSLTSSFVLT
jgi:hypothetical protein